MNLQDIHSLATDVVDQETALIREQQAYLQVQKGYHHFLSLNISELQTLLGQLKEYAPIGMQSPMLLACLKITIEARIIYLRRQT
jgi:hypothetical protein